MADDFYWRTARDSALTPTALQHFQLFASHEGEEFDQACSEIDQQWSRLRGKAHKRHGGVSKTAARVFQEVGWFELITDEAGKKRLRITPAGREAIDLLATVPDFLKAAPYFIVKLLSRYQLNNPARPEVSKNAEYDAKLAQSDVFPYRTLFSIMRALDNKILAEELQRYVFKIHTQADVKDAIEGIKKLRSDRLSGGSEEEIDNIHPPRLSVSGDQAKYVMGRLGKQAGSYPPVVEKRGSSEWILNKYYIPFIDKILANPPKHEEYPSEEAWMSIYGAPVPVIEDKESLEIDGSEKDGDEDELDWLVDDLPNDDPHWLEIKALVDAGQREICLTGIPGTSKSWYAEKLAIKLANCESRRIERVQFHPSYGYEDFVEGYVPSAIKDAPGFKLMPKVFRKLCVKAEAASANEHFVLVIDELSRGDVSRIFGELLTYLEYRGRRVRLAYSGKKMAIPENLIIIATMNPHDRSVAELDDAMDRRFWKIELKPSVPALKAILDKAEAPNHLKGKIIKFFNWVNNKYPPGIGHAYFSGISKEDDLERLWKHKLLPKFRKQLEFEADAIKTVTAEFEKIAATGDMEEADAAKNL